MGTPNPAEAKIDIKISAADTVSHAPYPVITQKFDSDFFDKRLNSRI